uniref:MsrB domain-containing protein n=1 Tax=Octactis speculum TaxID=3111310 RepID=A0A7S2BNZ7_9STRA
MIQCKGYKVQKGRSLALRPQATSSEPLSDSSDAALSPVSVRARDVLRGGTEPAFSSELDTENRAGTFVCAGCLEPLFPSECKFDSGTGWPSFWAGSRDAIKIEDGGLFSNPLATVFGREVKCSNCGGHLGHRFDDGPRKTTGKRFCINGAALRFRPDITASKGTP